VTVLAVGLGALMEAEGRDRINMTLPGVQRQLLAAVAKVAKKLVVVVVSAGGVDLGDESGFDAVLWAPYGGEEAGTGLAQVLLGTVNPSGRMPVTVYKQSWADAMNCKNITPGPPGSTVNFKEDCATSILHFDLEPGLGKTHRYVNKSTAATHVRHAFGFGLSYTDFVYSALTVSTAADGSLSISVSVKNSGSVDGAEVVEAYLQGATVAGQATALHDLVAFGKTAVIKAGANVTLKLTAPTDQLSTAMADGSRKVVAGKRTLSVGGHGPQDTEATGKLLTAQVTLK